MPFPLAAEGRLILKLNPSPAPLRSPSRTEADTVGLYHVETVQASLEKVMYRPTRLEPKRALEALTNDMGSLFGI